MGDEPDNRSLYELALARLAEESVTDSAHELAARLQPAVRASSAVVLWRRLSDRLEVFWVRRSPQLSFMGGWHAFPGGARSRGDAGLEVAGTPSGSDDGSREVGMPGEFMGGVDLEPVLASGIVAGALRELFEETGVLPGAEAHPRGAPEGFGAARLSLLAGEMDFAEALTDLGFGLCADDLVYAGRWLTPPLGPRRFDNRFFLLEWPVDRQLQPEVIPGELEEGEWVDPKVAIARWESGGVIAAPPILHILRVLAEEGPQNGLERMRDPSETNLGPFRRIEFRPGVLLFPLETPTLPPAGHTNAYVLGHENMVLVDPGSPYKSQIEGLVSAIRALEADGRKVTAIWLTHHHRDHVGGVEALRRELGVPVCAHRLTALRLAPIGIQIDQILEDGQRVVLGGGSPSALQVFHTPGHARGHLVFLDEATGSLIAGDLVAGFGTIVIDPPEGDMSEYFASLEKARALGATTVFPGHGPTIHQPAGLFDRFIQHRRWREEKILGAWLGGVRETEGLLNSVYDEIEPMARPLAARQLEAHLVRLRELGSI
ncbi:MAG: MBL fold metallo-hydrolase [Acidobacteriota bacterium]|nr:MBL fold metallo-hydrolase [Acidobacteriota bacterium]